MIKYNCLRKVLIVGIIFLFIGVSVSPGIGTIKLKKEDVEPKEYLFQTIIDIANNPEVKELFGQIENKAELIRFDYDFRSVFLKLLFRNPRLFCSLLFIKPHMTQKYLDFGYKQGCEIVNTLGEDEVLEIVESVEMINTEFFDDLNYIIMNDEELHNRITTLAEMNKELKMDSPFQYNPIICFYLMIQFTQNFILYGLYGYLALYFINYPILSDIFWGLAVEYLERFYIVEELMLEYCF